MPLDDDLVAATSDAKPTRAIAEAAVRTDFGEVAIVPCDDDGAAAVAPVVTEAWWRESACMAVRSDARSSANVWMAIYVGAAAGIRQSQERVKADVSVALVLSGGGMGLGVDAAVTSERRAVVHAIRTLTIARRGGLVGIDGDDVLAILRAAPHAQYLHVEQPSAAEVVREAEVLGRERRLGEANTIVDVRMPPDGGIRDAHRIIEALVGGVGDGLCIFGIEVDERASGYSVGVVHSLRRPG